MAIRSRTRITASLALSVAIAGSIAGTAGARIPEPDWGNAAPARRAVVAVPDAVERAVQRRKLELRVVAAAPDAFERAVQRQKR